MTHYDYIIAGAGCAGLSLLARMLSSGRFGDKRILLVDRAPKTANDRTWCYWEREPGFFEPLVYHSWSKLYFHSDLHSRQLDIRPFRYKMIRGIDLYRHCFELLAGSNVDVIYEEVESVHSEKDRAYLKLKDRVLSADYLFSSLMPAPLQRQPGRQYLWQHFRGWIVQANEDCFTEDTATLMDFRISQDHGASFVYILPFSPRRAMVEYTVFSEALLAEASYTEMLRAYMDQTFPGVSYSIEAEEGGKIPMTDHSFPRADNRIIYLGTAGGNTKPSSGYTFQAIQAHSDALADAMIKRGNPELRTKKPGRFMWYDSVLLRVLREREVPAGLIFDRLFCRNSPERVLRFLDNATTLGEELSLIGTLPKLPFIRAAAHHVTTTKKS